MDLGNYVLIALVFGQFATNTQFSPDIFKMGIAVGAICYMMSYLVSKWKEVTVMEALSWYLAAIGVLVLIGGFVVVKFSK